MPWADYECPYCFRILQNHRFDSHVGAAASAPPCPACVCPQMVPIAAINLDLRSDSRSAAGKFTVHRLQPTRDGQLVQVEETVDSLHAAQRIERDSEQRYRDGEGEPLRFRALHQDRSNLDRNSFGTEGRIGDRLYDSGHAPSRPKPVTRHGQKKPRVTVAKGGGKSPL